MVEAVSLSQFFSQSAVTLYDCDSKGRSLLHIAIENRLDEIVGELVESGLSLDMCDHDCMTPLLLAVRLGYKNMVRFLLFNGADSSCSTHVGNTVMVEAIIAKKRPVIDLLLTMIDAMEIPCSVLNQSNNDGLTSIHYAVLYHDLSLVKALILLRVSLTVQDREGNTPLHLAVKCGHVAFIPVLAPLSSLTLTNEKGRTPLDYAQALALEPSLCRFLHKDNFCRPREKGFFSMTCFGDRKGSPLSDITNKKAL